MADRDIPGPKKNDPDAFSQLPSARLSATPGNASSQGRSVRCLLNKSPPPFHGCYALDASGVVRNGGPQLPLLPLSTSYHALNTRRRARESC